MLIFASLKSLIPKVDGTVTDNWIFRLHCNVTIIFLIAFTILCTSREYFGEPIQCDSNTDALHLVPVLNQYCWIQSTYSFPSHWEGKVGVEIVYPGVGPNYRTTGIEEEKVEHKYYQWVVFMLCLQAILFYVPRYLWKIWEAGKTHTLLQELNNPVVEEEEKKKKINLLTAYFVNNLCVHNAYAYKYAFCEVLNLVNVIGQIFMINKFLGGTFTTYGTEVFSFMGTDQPDRVDPMIKVFPRMTKCNYFRYGASGEPESIRALCVLPLNIIYEKIYIFMWLWFCILTTVTCIAVIYRFLVMSVPIFRVWLLRTRSRLVPAHKISAIVSKLVVGDWFMMYQLSKNMDATNFRDFLEMLDETFEKQSIVPNHNGKFSSSKEKLAATWT